MRNLPMTPKLKRLKRRLFIDFFLFVLWTIGGIFLMVFFTARLENYVDSETTASISKSLFYIWLCVGFVFVIKTAISGYSFMNEYDKQLRTREERGV